MRDNIKVLAPATVSNVSCGFDILGFPLEGIGDTITVRKSNKKRNFYHKDNWCRLTFIE